MDVNKAVLERQDEAEDDNSCYKTLLQCMNKSVGRQEVSAPNASCFLSHLPLVRHSRQFVSVSLGTDRLIVPAWHGQAEGEWAGNRDQEGAGGNNRGDKQPATARNVADKFRQLVVKAEGTRCTTATGEAVAVENISLYEFASGPLNQEPIGTRVPVPSGGNVDCAWPLPPSYAKAMLMLHKPGFVGDGGNEWTDVQWLHEFNVFCNSEQCPPMIQAEVAKAQDTFHKKQAGWDLEEDSGPDLAPAEEELQEGDEHFPEGVSVMRAGRPGGGDAADEEDPGFDRQLYMGIDDDTDWESLTFDCGMDPSEAWPKLQALLAEKEQALRPDGFPPLTHKKLDECTPSQRAAVLKVFWKMVEIHRCGTDEGALRAVEPLRLIIAGTAGTGKSRVIEIVNNMATLLFGAGSVRNVAPSGTAASLIKGRTLQSLFPIPFGKGLYKPLKAPDHARLSRLQRELQGLLCLCLDERSMVGTVTFGWLEFLLRVGMYSGCCADESYGGLKILLLFGDDGQLPPVFESRLFQLRREASEAGKNGAFHYRAIRDCIFLTDVVRQRDDQECYSCSERWHAPGEKCSKLRDFLLKLRYQKSPGLAERYGRITEEDVEWLRERQVLQLPKPEAAKFASSKALFIHPRRLTVSNYNRKELLKLSAGCIPVVKCLAKDTGPCCRGTMDSNGESEYGQMPRLTYLCRGAPVMLTNNLCPQWGLFNGSMGSVVDIFYANGRKPSRNGKELPDCVFMHLDGYTGPEVIPGHPKIVPIGPNVFQGHCAHACHRTQLPIRMCWAITVHKSQGMTVGPNNAVEYLLVDLGEKKTEQWAPGAAFVQLSRVSDIGSLALDSAVDEERFLPRVGPTRNGVPEEDRRLYTMHLRTLDQNPGCTDPSQFEELKQYLFNL